MKILEWLGMVPVSAGLFAPASARAACTASATHDCVLHNGATFQLKSDPAAAYASAPVLQVLPGITYTFEADAPNPFITSHPFYLTTNSSGGGAGALTGLLATAGSSFTFTPTAAQLAAGLYDQCDIHVGEGAAINAAPGC